MKKLGLFAIIALTTCSLAACGNTSHKNDSASKKTSSKVIKRHKKNKKKSKKSSSNSSSEVSSNSSSQAQQAAANNNQQKSSVNGQLPPANDLHDFVNRYGESPAAYLSSHYGMSREQAVQSVPNNMKTSGEIQDTIMLQKGQDPFK